jgi:hypothetical protein
MTSIHEMLELVSALYQLGQELPHYLLVLSELAEPSLSQDLRTPVLGRLFEEIPRLLTNITPLEFNKLMANVPQDAVQLRMLVNIYNISTIFQSMSCLQILLLSNHLIPPGPLPMQVEIMLKAQEHMKSWAPETPSFLHDELAKTSLDQERKRLLELEPKLPWELLQFFMEIIKLPKNESIEFFKWFVQLSRERVHSLVQIMQFEAIVILEYKRRVTLPSSTVNTPPPPTTTELFPIVQPPDLSIGDLEPILLGTDIDILMLLLMLIISHTSPILLCAESVFSLSYAITIICCL